MTSLITAPDRWCRAAGRVRATPHPGETARGVVSGAAGCGVGGGRAAGVRHGGSSSQVAASAERIEEVLSRLTACQREVITRHLRGMTQREIAAELGQPLSTVKSAEARAKLNLRRELAELLDRCPRLG
jgi:DNA-directed RNA polymerase specialized sigma24 family protein